MTTKTTRGAKAKAGRFYEILKEVGAEPYILTPEIHIPRMGIEARNRWRDASYLSLQEAVLQAQALATGAKHERKDFSETIERCLLGGQYEAVRNLFADDAAAWDAFLNEIREFNKIDGTDLEVAEGKGDAPETSESSG
ncbi:hypothetical protein PP405_11585 [Mycobacteroides abscessus]|nr:hypothetical protein [Mycobacteroides abscessus]MDM2133341.1 hypothetical protein [Mycobacteroides abscessus]MDM2145032.1 hypothetical protein [Mycobacteroides abscessus]MDM2153197.1 hypothetical protein [Mycobacteroides abscessus]MDM2182230.1 hypothetical protein [Mycobacteroides abscessus]